MSHRKQIGSSWSAKRWLEVLESFGWSNRLQRGRNYAKDGHVQQLEVQEGKILAKVTDSRRKTYEVSIKLAVITERDWAQVITVLFNRPVFMAKLLAGEMPLEIETAFTAAGVALFPQHGAEFITKCSCPDSANPCKHIAAVYYLLGQRFDEDPFLLFAMRGMDKEQIMARLREHWATLPGTNQEVSGELPTFGGIMLEGMMPRSLSSVQILEEATHRGTFWSVGEGFHQVSINLQPETLTPDSLPRVWGPPEFAAQGGHVVDLMANMYKEVSRLAKEEIDRMNEE